MKVGDRVQLEDNKHKRGVIQFIGPYKEKGEGIIVGIQLDEPFGDCDGDGYFNCMKKCG